MFKSKFIACFCLVALTAGAQIARADDDGMQTAGDLRLVVSETVMYKAQAARAQARAELAKATGTDSPGALGVAQEREGLPRVSQIVEARGVKSATFIYPNGTVDLGIGDSLPNDYKIVSMSTDTSLVGVQKKGGKVVLIPVTSGSGLTTAESSSSTSAQNGSMSVPGLGARPMPSVQMPAIH
jgi:type IV pilus biogenesis protein PilP